MLIVRTQWEVSHADARLVTPEMARMGTAPVINYSIYVAWGYGGPFFM